MSRTKAQRAASAPESLAILRELLPAGTPVYCRLDHVSRSGMLRRIGFHVVKDGEIQDISWHVANVLDYPTDDNHALKVPGAGMDMGFHVVYHLSTVIHGNQGGYELKHRWL